MAAGIPLVETSQADEARQCANALWQLLKPLANLYDGNSSSPYSQRGCRRTDWRNEMSDNMANLFCRLNHNQNNSSSNLSYFLFPALFNSC